MDTAWTRVHTLDEPTRYVGGGGGRHATPTMTQRYAHLAPDHLASAVARLNFAAPTQSGVADLGEARRKQAVGVV